MAHVLIVHDDDDVRDMLTMLFEEAGHEVRSAPNNVVGLRELADCPPCVVLFQREWQKNDQNGLLGLLVSAGQLEIVASHQFVLLAIQPEAVPEPLAQLVEQYSVPVVPEPFDMDTMLGIVDHAATVLQTPS